MAIDLEELRKLRQELKDRAANLRNGELENEVTIGDLLTLVDLLIMSVYDEGE